MPMIIRWPGKVAAGQKTDAITCLTDIYTTLQSITGQPREAYGGEDGFDLSPLFQDPAAAPRDTLISHSISGNFAIRRGPWKLCLAHGSGGWSSPKEAEAKKQGLPPMQLFNLDEDRAEQSNLVDKHPEIVNELLVLLQQQVDDGRCTPGTHVDNDRTVTTGASKAKSLR